jgi:TonB family protein
MAKSSRVAPAAILAVAAAALATAANAAELVAPAYPSEQQEKPLQVTVVARAAITGGKAGEVEVLRNDGSAVFAAAAAEALGKSTFDESRTNATVWYVFRLLQDTKTTDVSAEAGRKLDADPELLEYVAPEFPPGAPSIRTEVTVDLLIGPDGRVWHAEVSDSGTNEVYAESAVVAARQFTFNPATLDGKPTLAWYPFIIEFN